MQLARRRRDHLELFLKFVKEFGESIERLPDAIGPIMEWTAGRRDEDQYEMTFPIIYLSR